jgi:hypothetical protein
MRCRESITSNQSRQLALLETRNCFSLQLEPNQGSKIAA